MRVTVNFTLTSTGYPTATFTHSGTLPTGLTFAATSGGQATITGTPIAAATSTFKVTAANGVSPPATQTITVTVG